MKKGDKVKFKEIREAGDETLVFEVLEDRGDRALVSVLDNPEEYSIEPTFVYFSSELEVIA